MHLALTKDDIIIEIFGHFSLIQRPPTLESALRTYQYWRPLATSPEFYTHRPWAEDGTTINRHTLYSLSLTCKVFSQHASNELWTAPLGGLYSLLSLFSSFVAEDGTFWDHRFRRTEPLLHHYFLKGQITPREWSTFKKYASRVREIGYHAYWGYGAHYRIDSSVFITLHELNGGQPLFPNLRFLAWSRCPRNTRPGQSESADDDPKGYEKLLRMLVVPSITVLSLWHPSLRPDGESEFSMRSFVYTNGVDDDIKTIVSSCPRLRHIFIQLEYSSTALATLASCRELRTFKACTTIKMTSEAVVHLSRIPTLEVFEGSVDDRQSAASVEPPDNTEEARIQRVLHRLVTLSPGSFPKLRRLSLNSVLLSIAAPILTAISSHTVPQISISSEQDDMLDTLPAFLAALTNLHFTRSLTKLELSFYNEATESNDMPLCFGPTFSPLLSLTRLSQLVVSIYDRTLHVSEEDMRQMSLAWPEMSMLSLTYRWGYSDPDDPQQVPAHPSLSSAVRFARSFPRILFLHCDVAQAVEEDASSLRLKLATAEASSLNDTPQKHFSVAVLADGYEQLFVDGNIRPEIPLRPGFITRVQIDLKPWKGGGPSDKGYGGWYWSTKSEDVFLYLVPLTRP